MTNQLYSTNELADQFGLNRRQVVRRIKLLGIPHIRSGGGRGRGYYCDLNDFIVYLPYLRGKGTLYYAHSPATRASR